MALYRQYRYLERISSIINLELRLITKRVATVAGSWSHSNRHVNIVREDLWRFLVKHSTYCKHFKSYGYSRCIDSDIRFWFRSCSKSSERRDVHTFVRASAIFSSAIFLKSKTQRLRERWQVCVYPCFLINYISLRCF